MGSERKLIDVWNLSEQTRQAINAEFRDLSLIKRNQKLINYGHHFNFFFSYILTSHDFS